MGSFFQRKPVRRFLKVFKWCRVTFLLAIFLVIAALAYLQLVGLPASLKKPLLRALRQRGFEAQFVSARLEWGPSILIENAAFSPTNQAAGPRLSAERTELKLNAGALLHGRLQVDSFEVVRASLRVPIAPTNQEPLLLTDVNLWVTLSTNNVVSLKDCTAWTRGVRIHLNGQISDFLSMFDWKLWTATNPFPSAASPANPASTNRPTAWEVLQQIRFTGTPELRLSFYADGQDQNTLRTDLQFAAAGVQTPWGQSGSLQLNAVGARFFNSGSTPFFHANLQASNVVTDWTQSRHLEAVLDFSRDAATNFAALAHLTGQEVSASWPSPSGTNWVRVSQLQWDGTTTLLASTLKPETFEGTLRASKTESAWGAVGAASLVLQSRRVEASPADDPAWGPWNQIKTFTLDWQADATNISILTPKLAKLELERVEFKAGWHPPQLTIENLEAVMYHGQLQAGATLDVASREVQARATVGFDPHQIAPLLTGPAQHWISLYNWETSPHLSADLRFVLPPWTNRIDDWPEESRDNVQLAGDFSIQKGAFRGIGVSSAQARFSYTNRVWNVSSLRVAGEGGTVDLDYTWSDRTDDYHFRVGSKLDPAIARALLTEPQQRTLDAVSFRDKPEVQGDVWGNWQTPATIGFAATLSTGQFLVRGEKVDQLQAQLAFTNHFLRISQLKLVRDTGQVLVPQAGIDFASNVYTMTNASSTIDPEPVRRALGEVAPPFMKEIHFDTPPLVKAHGSFSPGDDDGTDMHFDVQGEHFHWQRLTVDKVHGIVDYHIRTVVVTNVEAGAYKNGKLRGWITFQWEPQRGTGFNSAFNLNDIDLAALVRAFDSKSNKIEGILDGSVALGVPMGGGDTNAFGGGWLRVTNGLLWEIKLFGALSPMLNAIAPGSGNSRARAANATFSITNGVLTTRDLEIRSTGFRLLYSGTIDSKERLDADVEAKLLRDTPVFNHLFSWMLLPLDKLFEYHVSGTWRKPVIAPKYIPPIFMKMLHPFRSLKPKPPQAPAKPNPAPAPTPPTPQN
jgi:hypothetical protein